MREKVASQRNIVIPLQDIVNLQKVIFQTELKLEKKNAVTSGSDGMAFQFICTKYWELLWSL